MEPPKARPNDFKERAYMPPPPTLFKLVTQSDMEKAVANDTVCANTKIITIFGSPTLTANPGNNKKTTAPKIASKEGIKTPEKVPSFGEDLPFFWDTKKTLLWVKYGYL